MKVMLEHQGHQWDQDEFDQAIAELQQHTEAVKATAAAPTHKTRAVINNWPSA